MCIGTFFGRGLFVNAIVEFALDQIKIRIRTKRPICGNYTKRLSRFSDRCLDRKQKKRKKKSGQVCPSKIYLPVRWWNCLRFTVGFLFLFRLSKSPNGKFSQKKKSYKLKEVAFVEKRNTIT